MLKRFVTILIISLAGISLPVSAEQSETFGDYTVHYSAFTTDMLTREVAKSYGIRRSKNRALLNISVLKKMMGVHGSPVKAKVEATATNLTGQLRELVMKEIVVKDKYEAIYYLGEASVDNEETLKYEIVVTPEGEEKPLKLSFQQKFFTN